MQPNQPRPAGPLTAMWESFQDFCAILAHIFTAITLVSLVYFLNAWHVVGFVAAIAPLCISVVFLVSAWFITGLGKYFG